MVFVSGGTVNGDLIFKITTANPITIGTSNLTFSALSGYTVTSFIETLLDDASAAAARTTLDAQQLDAELTAIAGVTSAADKVPYFTGSGTASVTDLTAAARTFLALPSSANQFAEIKQAASDSATGVVEKATQAELEAETADKYPDAALMKYHPGVAKAWVNFNGTDTVSIRASHNVSSITDNGTGDYTVNLGVTMSSANYCVAGMSKDADVATVGWGFKAHNFTATSFDIATGGDGTSSASLNDNAIVCATVFGDI